MPFSDIHTTLHAQRANDCTCDELRKAAAMIEEDPLLSSVHKVGKVGQTLGDWAVWSVVTESSTQFGIARFGAHDLRRMCAKLCRKAAGTRNRSSSC